jgi:hypothetical protein
MFFIGKSLLGCILLLLTPQDAWACALVRELDLEDVLYADVVVIGRVSNYRIEDVALNEGNTGRFARFDIQVDYVLKGEAPGIIPTALGYSIPAEMPAKPQLFALRNRELGSHWPPGSSGTLRPIVDRVEQFSILASLCGPPLILDALDEKVSQITRMLSLEK